MLPIGPVGEDGSPYFGTSAFAGNPLLLAATSQVDDGSAVSGPHADDAGAVPAWLDDFALFSAIRAEQSGQPWWAWPAALRDRDPAALDVARERLAPGTARVVAEQREFERQWRALKEAARERGVLLIGDVPMYVAPDSADTWVHRDLFMLAADGRPAIVAGVPPDYFAEDGQWWGNPVYRWGVHRATGFHWWIERLRVQLSRFDLVRFDHFRGLEACWEIDAAAATAREGRWVEAPGAELLTAATDAFGRLPLLAEDLGVITPPVEALRDEFGLPGMRVLQFGFDGSAANPHVPHNYVPGCVAYTGTHDNDTTTGWFASLDPHSRDRVCAYLGCREEDAVHACLRAVLASVARLAVLPMQDLLGLGSEARMNLPGSAAGHWRWRLPTHVPWNELAARYAPLNRLYGRNVW
jgi:4-alpha-glucanotransferase